MKPALRPVTAASAACWCALAVGAALRLYCVVFTEGSFDVAIKQHHGHQIARLGLLGWYEASALFNHPPLMGRFFSGLVRASDASGVPFRILLRAPFALLDLATAYLLHAALRERRGARWIPAAYALHPLAILYSSYHGNTDSALPAFGLLALLGLARGAPLAAGVALGAALWIKLPILVATPALLFCWPTLRGRLVFAAAFTGCGALGYLPELALAPGLLADRILGYAGSPVTTPSGVPIWGFAAVFGFGGSALADWLRRINTPMCWSALIALALLRRRQRTVDEVGVTLAASHCLFYALSSFWAWQYLAWCVPYLFFLGWRWAAASAGVLGAYVYGAYALFSGDLLLRHRWDLVDHAPWPFALDVLRAASLAFCCGVALCVLWPALRAEWVRWRAPR